MSGSRAPLPKPRPGHRGQLPTPGSHRTWRAVFASLHLRCPAPRSSTGGSQHFAAIRSRFVSTVSFILSLHRGLSLPLHGARVAPERVTCRQPLPPVNGSPVLRVLSTGLTSARLLDRPCLGGLSGLAPEPDGSPLFTSSPSVTCQRYEPRKRPGPLAMSRYRDAAFPVERSGRPLRSRSISGLSLRSLAFRPATFLSTLRSGCYQTPRKTRYTAAWLRLCRGRHFRRLNSTRLQGATLPKLDVR